MKQTVYAMTEALGVNRLSAVLNRGRPVIVTLHGVTSDLSDTICNQEGLHLHRPLFERLMEHVARYYNPVPMARIVDWLEGKDSPPERAVCVTFDDGFRNVLTDAAPVLKRLGIPATLFVTTDFVFAKKMLWPDRLISALTLTRVGVPDAANPSELEMWSREKKLRTYGRLNRDYKAMPNDERLTRLNELIERLGVKDADLFSAWSGFRPLEPEELKLLPGFGITVGAHTCSHPILSRLSAAEQTRELAESRRLIEAMTGVACDEFAYPNGGPGDFDAGTRGRVIDAGYRCALTTIKRRVSPGDDRFEIPRCTITHNQVSLAEFAAEMSGLPGALRALLDRPGARTGARSASSPQHAALST